MTKPNPTPSDLDDLNTRRDLELGYPLHEAVRERVPGADMHVTGTASIQELVGQPGSLAQDAFRALVIRQSRLG